MQNHTQKQIYSSILSVLATNTMSFGNELFKRRKAKGMTQQELATACGVNVSYISNLEREFSPTAKGGKPQPSLSLVDKFAKVLDVNKDTMRLAAGYAPENSAPEVPKPILESFQRSGAETLSENDVDLVVNFIDMLKKHRRGSKE